MEEERQPFYQRVGAFLRQSLHTLRLLLIGALFAAGVTLIVLAPTAPIQEAPYDLDVGEIAAENIRAPRDLTYISDVETEAAREAALRDIDDVYTDPDPRIGRQQRTLARNVMAFIETVRQDEFADVDLKITYLQEITRLSMTENTATTLIAIPANQFEQVEQETLEVLEDTMSSPVREGRITEVTDNLELLVSPQLAEELVPVVVALTSDLIVPNSEIDEVETEASREAALTEVEPVMVTFQAGQIIVREGEEVDSSDLEALREFGLTEQEPQEWPDTVVAGLIALMTTTILGVYLSWRASEWLEQPWHLFMFAAITLLFLFGAQILVSEGNTSLAFLFPAAALAMILCTLTNLELAVLVSIVLAAITGYLSDTSLEVASYLAVTGLFAAGSLRQNARLNGYFLSGMVAAAAGIATLLIFRLPTGIETQEMGILASLSLISGLISAGGALVIILLLGNLTGITTSLQLIDLTRPDHPLQRKLQREAIGTYHHTLAVANLAEAAAEAIGADSLLTRVGILYHDIGKTIKPDFFIENRMEGMDDSRYEHLSPAESAAIIKSHVTEGVRMAKNHRLPSVVIDFIRQHHGTRPIMFFLTEAREAAAKTGEEVNESDFTYAGPRPQRRETGIALLADACESATRANRPDKVEQIEAIVDSIFESDIINGQLNESNLSLTDIETIRGTFIYALRGMHHSRIKYPKADAIVPEEDEEADVIPGAKALTPQEEAEAKEEEGST